ncbi:hypothetical protein GGX14DRAFT_380209 [Mycena pura]|uniref:ASCH domain-containing protein n=1 Tax=Mycena pura TaxID=153505 RepID=A0AAD6XZN8_9AGAR|nr:hypothetical protein GGX14DRAFT_380209 [Mycena pura]
MPAHVRTDCVLPMTDDYMQNIVRGEKTYEFRRYRIPASVERIWFYLNAPLSRIAYVCEIDPAVTRNEGDPKLPEDGLGNKEYNTFHKDWRGYDFAYRVRSVYEILEPITLAKMKSHYGCGGAPRGLIYLPETIANEVSWRAQKCIIPRIDKKAPDLTLRSGDKRPAPVDGDGDVDSAEASELQPRKVCFVFPPWPV